MSMEFMGGFKIRVSEVKTLCEAVKRRFVDEEQQSKERVAKYLAQVPVFCDFGFAIQRFLKIKLRKQFSTEEIKHLVANASGGHIYSDVLVGQYRTQDKVHDIWFKNRVTRGRDLEKAVYLLSAVALVDSEHVYLETKDASWLGNIQRRIQ